MTDNRNTILAVILSGLVLIAWQYFYNVPQMEKQRAQQQTQTELQKSTPQPTASATPGATPQSGNAAQPSATPAANQQAQPVVARDTAIAAAPRVKIDTPRLAGSVSLKGGRIDDLALVQYRETVNPSSPPIILYSPSGTAEPYYAEFGWVPATGVTAKLPDAQTIWQQDGSGSLTPSTPVVLKWDNGEGLSFRRTISVDDHYLFTVKDEVTNVGNAPVTLYPFALISRHGTPQVSGYYILHEGLIGYLGDQGLQEYAYKKIDEAKQVNFKVTNGWLGITDKYWASALLPDTNAQLQARFSSNPTGNLHTYQTDYLLDPVTVAIGGTATANARLFAGAKEAGVVGVFPFAGLGGYNKELGLNHFDLLIDWGWFYFITKPMFLGLDFFYRFFGNFGISILLVTVIVKLLFFSLYKVLFVTIEMRHAPFYGWIKDLSAPDPTNLFNLFGLIPFDPTTIPVFGHYLWLGIWPIVMGITMWFQMKLNPTPPDPTQKIIFDWMPLIFTFMLAGFPAGLVIYWAWNNLLSVIQQSFIMRRNGVKVELFDNLKATFAKKAT
jgi:YidC/Oxa1 family membrane protein insertase